MPFKSQAQRRYLFAQHPTIAAEFAAATPKGTKLPERVSGKKPSKKPSEKQAAGAGWNPEQAMLKTLPGQAPSLTVPQQPAMKDAPRAQTAQTGLGVRAGTPLLGSAPVSPALTPAPTAPSMPTQAPSSLGGGAPTAAFMPKAASVRLQEALTMFEATWGKEALVSSPATPLGGHALSNTDSPAIGGAPRTGYPALAAMQAPAMSPAPMPAPTAAATNGRTPGFTNPAPGALNPLGAGSLAYGGARAPGAGANLGMGKTSEVTGNQPPSPHDGADEAWGEHPGARASGVDFSKRRPKRPVTHTPNRATFNGRSLRVIHGPKTHTNGRFSNMGRNSKTAATSIHRELGPDEQEQVVHGQARTLPDLIWGGGTPLPNTMSSPGKGAILNGAIGAGVGGLAGYGLGHLAGQPAAGAALGAVAGGAALGTKSYLARSRWNEDAVDLMRRLPEGATYRDYQSDAGNDYDMDQAQNMRAMRYIARDLTHQKDAAMMTPELIAAVNAARSSIQKDAAVDYGEHVDPKRGFTPEQIEELRRVTGYSSKKDERPFSERHPYLTGGGMAAGTIMAGPAAVGWPTIGAGIGAYRAPRGHRMEGAARGAGAGLGAVSGLNLGALGGTLAGGGLGALGGALGGAGLGVLGGALTGSVSEGATLGAGLGGVVGGVAGSAAGGLYGAYRGAKGGHGYANKLMGKPSWEQDAKKDKDDTPEKKANDPMTQEQVDAALRQAGMVGAKGMAAFGGTGAALGMAGAPSQHMTQGAVRGGIAGIGTGFGAVGGGLAGFGAGAMLGQGPSGNGDSTIPALAGGAGGALLGGLAGHGLANAAMGKPGWERDEEKEAAAREDEDDRSFVERHPYLTAGAGLAGGAGLAALAYNGGLPQSVKDYFGKSPSILTPRPWLKPNGPPYTSPTMPSGTDAFVPNASPPLPYPEAAAKMPGIADAFPGGADLPNGPAAFAPKAAGFIPAPRRAPTIKSPPAMGNGVKPAQVQPPLLDYRYRAAAPRPDFLGGYGRASHHDAPSAPTPKPAAPARDSFSSFRGSPMA